MAGYLGWFGPSVTGWSAFLWGYAAPTALTLHSAALINTLIERGTAVIAIALRMPYDLRAYPRASAYLCTYSLQPASLQAAAQVLWGQLTCQGQLPVTVL